MVPAGLVVATCMLGKAGETLMLGFGLAALTVTLVSIRRYRPSKRWPWWAICGALALFLVAGVARTALHTLGNLAASRSLLPDFWRCRATRSSGGGLFGFSLARDRGRQRHLGIILDGLIAALAILAVAWVYVIDPELFHHQTPLAVRLVLTCYPAMSIFLVVVTLRIAFSPDQDRVPAYWFLLVAMTCMFVGDSLYMFADIDLVSVPGRSPRPSLRARLPGGRAPWPLHPSMRALTEPAGNRPQAIVAAVATRARGRRAAHPGHPRPAAPDELAPRPPRPVHDHHPPRPWPRRSGSSRPSTSPSAPRPAWPTRPCTTA